MLHLILDGYVSGEMFCVKLIRCHRTELISATTLACMGRPWLGLSVCSLMRITKVGRLCTRGYPGPVRGDSLESWFYYWDPFHARDKVYGPCDGRLPCDGRCVWRTQRYPRHEFRSM